MLPMRVVLPLVMFLFGAVGAFGADASPAPAVAPSDASRPVLFNTAFESGSLGKIEKLGETEFRLHLKGQQDARGRNRQATWFFFRMDDVGGRELTLRLTSFKGEYIAYIKLNGNDPAQFGLTIDRGIPKHLSPVSPEVQPETPKAPAANMPKP